MNTSIVLFTFGIIVGFGAWASRRERTEAPTIHFSVPALEWLFHSSQKPRDFWLAVLICPPAFLFYLAAKGATRKLIGGLIEEPSVVAVVFLVGGFLLGGFLRHRAWPLIVRCWGVKRPASVVTM